ncbi:xanthine dehydrogenase family protein molybdopterin-binding subunit [Hymenobacter koreensis]|uniref:Molybdopterin-dependent oxidoreductase n=1 Tax=Hymenobacter koreensis TaxID=1084523 RepID=A0ABP8IYH2_9BACT
MPTKAKPVTGEPLNRVDGRLKVTGRARYAAEHPIPAVTHGVLVTSTVAKGRIKSLDTKAAEQAPGVLAIITHLNSPKVPGYEGSVNNNGARLEGQEHRVFYDDRIYFSNQPVALAVAGTLEQAQLAASLVKVQYEAGAHQTDLEANLAKGVTPKRGEDYSRGKVNAYKTAAVRVEAEYRTPVNVHNPMETHAAIAAWQGPEKLTVYNKTQAVKIAQQDHMKAFQLKRENVQVFSPFVGGAFGSSSRVWPQEMAAVLGAKVVGRPVKIMLRRDQVFNMVGFRPRSIQQVKLGATKDGTLTGITHEAYGLTSSYEQFTERIVDLTQSMYRCPNVNTVYKLVPLDVSTPCWTRGPGEASGSFALESAMDELAYALNMDPLALRLKNYADTDPAENHPWSTKFLRECYEQGAARFGWSKRNPAPGATRDGDWLVGQGMATGMYHANRRPASARALLRANGTLLVQSATADVGVGTATIMTQIAADAMGMDPANIQFELGNSSLPPAPGQFGSQTTTSVGSAVHDVCLALRQKLLALAQQTDGSALRGVATTDLMFENGTVARFNNDASRLSYADILKRNNLPSLEVTLESKGGAEQEKYSSQAFCANFVEVRVHALTGEVRVSRVVSALDVGKVMNRKTARSQVYGSVVWGIGMALMEDAMIDHRYGRFLNRDLADYHLPVNADVPAIDVLFIDKPDMILDPIGAKGMGEVGLVGFSAAVANAVFHATGKRIRELPITPDKLV